MNGESAVLEVRNLSKSYGEVQALADVNLSVGRGELVALIGPSGAGKSTLLRCINRMIDATTGEVVFENVDVQRLARADLRRVRTKIGMIFQHYNLVYRLTVIENVLHGRLGYLRGVSGIIGRYSELDKARAVEIIRRVGLLEQIYKRCDALSGGQMQRVGIARALIQDPQIILCDEPIASLDPSTAKVIMDYLRTISSELGIAVLVSLHQVDVALKYADRILGVNGGRIVFDGIPAALTREMVYEIYDKDEGELVLD
ncbi:MAG TPA: phosphonate ABC transporter ATP-binding protein [Spirochaetia bacterium]|nr:phosphonate ABC transporter ATP-binding protein [Spirochaetia bacterium]